MDLNKINTGDGTTQGYKNPAIRKETGGWKACYFTLGMVFCPPAVMVSSEALPLDLIILTSLTLLTALTGNEGCERLAYYGMSTNLVNYLQICLNQGKVSASNNVTNWSGTCYVTPLLGAFLADAYLGRYWTIAIFSIVYFLGMSLLTLSAAVPGLKPSCNHDDVCHPTQPQISLIILMRMRRNRSSFFNLYYLSINIGALIASSVLVWIQMNVGWGWGFGVPAVAMAIAVFSFFSGTRLYRHQRPGGSHLTRILQVIVASFRKIHVEVPSDESLLFETADQESSIQGSRKLHQTKGMRAQIRRIASVAQMVLQLSCNYLPVPLYLTSGFFSFFNKAALETLEDRNKGLVNPWRLSTVTRVEELKSIIRVLPTWASGVVLAAVYSQMSTMFVLQGNTMDPHIGPYFKIPSASVSIFDTISVIFWVPVYDRIIVQLARRYTGHKNGFTLLQRIGIGLVISVFAMLAAGIVEVSRLNLVRKHNYYDLEYLPMSIFWQIPQYFLIGCSEVFTFIGQLEFFYDDAPDAMRSTCSALLLTTNALGSYLNTLLVIIITKVTSRNGSLGWIPDNLNRDHLDYFYWLIAALSVVNFLVYLWIAKWHTNKKVKVYTCGDDQGYSPINMDTCIL